MKEAGCESTRREDRTKEMFCIIYGLQVENAAPMLMRERGWVRSNLGFRVATPVGYQPLRIPALRWGIVLDRAVAVSPRGVQLPGVVSTVSFRWMLLAKRRPT